MEGQKTPVAYSTRYPYRLFSPNEKQQCNRHHRIQAGNEAALKILLKLLLNSSYITISKLANNLKSMGIPVGKSTIDNYLSYIESSYFMKELFMYSPSVINQLQ